MKLQLLAFWAAIILLVICAWFGGRGLLVMACLIAGGAFFMSLRESLVASSKVNMAAAAGAAIGLFYFMGAIPVNASIMVSPDFISSYQWKDLRNYDVQAQALAGILAILFALAPAFLPRRALPANLGMIMSPGIAFGRSDDPRITRDGLVIRAFLIFICAVSAYLMLTNQIAVDYNPLTSGSGRVNMTLYFVVFIGAPAAMSMVAYLLATGVARRQLPLLAIVCGAVLLVTLFTLGRRPLLAGLICACVFMIAFLGLRVSRKAWLGLTALGLIAFMAASVPFLQLRDSQGVGTVSTVSDIFSPDTMARRSAQARPTIKNTYQVTVMRFDLLGELSQVVSLYPGDQFKLGQGMISQTSVLVPGTVWPNKREYLLTRVISDQKIMQEAGIRPSDIASTPVLFGYADFGWLAPIFYVVQLLLFLWSISFISGISHSNPARLIGLGVVLTTVLQVDNANFAAMLFGSAYFAVFATFIFLFSFICNAWVAGARGRIPLRRLPG